MDNELLSLVQQYNELLIALIVTIPRVYAFMDSSQFLNASAVPGVTRIGTMLALAILMSPANFAYAHAGQPSIAALAMIIFKEYAIGAILGYFVAWIFWVIQTTGTFIDNQRGAAIAASIDPLLGAESSPIGDMFSLVFLTYIFASGSVLQIIGLLVQSFRIWPAGQPWPQMDSHFADLALNVFDYAMRLSFDIAAPVVAVMFLAEFGLAMVSRFAPQVQVFILAMPIKSILAVFMLIFYMNYIFPNANRRIGDASVFISRFYSLAGQGINQTSVRSPPAHGGPP